MIHKTLEAKATTTDLGEFTAIAAAYTLDRGNERIVPGAFAKTIESWQASGKKIPLHWDHSGAASDIIGVVDPASMKEVEAGLMVVGKLDLEESEVAREAWRAIKSNAVALSFGYMVTDGAETKDGVFELKEIDLFEISVTPAPMNPDTRFLNLKSATTQTLVVANGAADVEMVKASLRRVKELASNLRESLAKLGTERFGGQDIYVYAEDYDPDAGWVVYCVSAPAEERYLKVGYATDGDTIELAAEEVEVTRTVDYRPVTKTQTSATDQAIEDARDEEPSGAKSHAQDPLKQASRDAMLEVLSDGASLQKYVEPEKPAPVEPPDGDDQHRRFVELHLP